MENIPYQKIAELEELKQKVVRVYDSLEDLELLMLQIKAYIQADPELRQIVSKILLDFEKVINSNRYKRLAKSIFKITSNPKSTNSWAAINARRYCFFFYYKNIEDLALSIDTLYKYPKPTEEDYENFKDRISFSEIECFPRFAVFKRFLRNNKDSLNLYMLHKDIDNILISIVKDKYFSYLRAITLGSLEYLVKAIKPGTLEYYKVRKDFQKTSNTKNTLSFKDNKYHLNGKQLELTANEQFILKEVLDFKLLSPSNYKTPISKLNRKINDAYSIKLIEFDKASNRYVINPNLRLYNC